MGTKDVVIQKQADHAKQFVTTLAADSERFRREEKKQREYMEPIAITCKKTGRVYSIGDAVNFTDEAKVPTPLSGSITRIIDDIVVIKDADGVKYNRYLHQIS